LPCVEDTPIPKFITERREAIYENAPPFRFGFADKCTSINRLFRTDVTAISYSKTAFFIEPESSDLTIYARPFIMFPVSSGWRRECPAVSADYLDIRPEDSLGIRKLKKLSALDSSQLENLPSDLLQESTFSKTIVAG